MATYTLKNTCTSIVAATPSPENQWLAGTNAVNSTNEVAVLTYQPDIDALQCTQSYSHPNSIWGMAVSRQDGNRIATLHSSGLSTWGVEIWARETSLQSVASCSIPEPQDRSVCWSPHAAQLAFANGNELVLADVQDGELQVASNLCTSDEPLQAHVFHPNMENCGAVAVNCSIKIWDGRDSASSGKSSSVKLAALSVIRCLDFTPHGQLVTGCDDGSLQWWDVRHNYVFILFVFVAGDDWQLADHLLSFFCLQIIQDDQENVVGYTGTGHQHAVLAVACHPKFPTLVASASCDASVCIWSAESSDRGSKAALDVHMFNSFEDSVVGVAWSSSDDWLLASACHDGRITCLRVPQQLQYKTMF